MSDDSQRFKADAGKTNPALVQVGFQRAFRLIQATTDYGAIKYEAHSWRKVPDAFRRYQEAAERHRQARLLLQKDERGIGFFAKDEESNLPHIAHELFCLLAMVELFLEGEPYTDLEKLCQFNTPPTAHRE